MIKINKYLPAPEKLQTDGKTERRRNSNLFTRNSEAYISNEQKFELNDGIYTHKSVKDALKEIQHSKCCYCEKHIKERSTVEHFRPKTSFRNQKSDQREYPGYYWLAYEWNNLYLACDVCNTNKNDYFPLLNPDERAISHKSDLTKERSVLLDPGNDEIKDFLSFNGEIAVGLDEETKRGSTTIKLIDLNRQSLVEKRLEKLKILKRLTEVVQLSKNQPENQALREQANRCEVIIEAYLADEGEFLGAVRCAIANNFEYTL